ncbi:MAG: sigma 54-interacting transcriptional regulator [Deltaproteobacteria bacterium]|nr:sigma 54-interacting transcriptional regulator [Deltaproteobacteria bacterium]
MSAPVHIRNETNELRLLFEVCQTLEATGDLGSQMEAILEFMSSHTAMLWGGITLSARGEVSRAGATWRSGSWLSKLPPGFEDEHPVAVHRESVDSMVLETGLPVAVQYEAANPTALHRGNLRTIYKEDIALFAVPLAHGGNVLGVFFADRLFADSVAAEEDVRLLQVIASLVAQALTVRLEFEQRHSAVVEENRRLQALLHDQFHPVGMVGNSAALQAVIRELNQVADSNATVLIRGESGTGKELAASAIHSNSSRAGKPFVRLNCAALPEGLVESELFGHERGAFTGATGMRKGRFEMAHGGTLFLDEVGDLTPLTQAKLLRVLQEKEFERVGGGQAIRVDVRLIAATNRDLEQMVAEGTFRQDLYYRLSVFPILLPPLRRRREDIMPLATHFAEKYGQENGRVVRRISPEATELLTAYAWPGNIRELENVIERAVLLCGPGGVIEAAHLPPALQGLEPVPAPFASESRADTLDAALEALELRMITEALSDSRGNMAKAASRLGITERIMGLRMKKYGLSFKEFRGRSQ